MAKKAKSKKSAPKNDENVVRIKAGASSSKKPTEAAAVANVEATPAVGEAPAKAKKAKTSKALRRGAPKALRASGGYFKGAWFELRQVRWPNRRATWSMTGAVLAYSAFFVVLVLLLDAGFKYLFQLILGK